MCRGPGVETTSAQGESSTQRVSFVPVPRWQWVVQESCARPATAHGQASEKIYCGITESLSPVATLCQHRAEHFIQCVHIILGTRMISGAGNQTTIRSSSGVFHLVIQPTSHTISFTIRLVHVRPVYHCVTQPSLLLRESLRQPFTGRGLATMLPA